MPEPLEIEPRQAGNIDPVFRAAERDAAREALAVLPDPEDFARALPLVVADALAAAWRDPEGWKASPEGADVLRRWGLCEARGRFLTTFGTRVRGAVMREDG